MMDKFETDRSWIPCDGPHDIAWAIFRIIVSVRLFIASGTKLLEPKETLAVVGIITNDTLIQSALLALVVSAEGLLAVCLFMTQNRSIRLLRYTGVLFAAFALWNSARLVLDWSTELGCGCGGPSAIDGRTALYLATSESVALLVWSVALLLSKNIKQGES